MMSLLISFCALLYRISSRLTIPFLPKSARGMREYSPAARENFHYAHQEGPGQWVNIK
ncbi:hypothetical protein HOLDEFILI_03672 [Holdemania filiformis DSM 12042]|uniref:Uncharacterized protein n=1 Tax=Holdemania filiformis DSM 12042 TaxID=545696 RepID=B9YCW1_9FIRM|nr:hypothetical protein HOLDEFILI_03672 [Holdemania filiformis DSM 12042]